MFYQVAGKHIEKHFRYQSDSGSPDVLSGRDLADREAEIDDIRRDDVDGAAEYDRPDPVFFDAPVDAPDHFLLAVLFLEVGIEGQPDHVESGYDGQQVDAPGHEHGRKEGHEKSQGHPEIKYRQTGEGAKDGEQKDDQDKIHLVLLYMLHLL